MRMKKISSFLFFLASVFAPSSVFAHEKWFIKEAPLMPVKPLLFSSWTVASASLAISALLALVAALLIHYAIRPQAWTSRMRVSLGAYHTWVPFLIRTLTGLLLFTASLSRFLFAPDLVTAVLAPGVERIFLSMELLVGLGLLVGFLPRVLALVGLALYTSAFFIFPVLSVASYLHLIGIFAYLIILGDPSLPKLKGGSFFAKSAWMAVIQKWKPHATPLLRIFAGLSFIFVGFLYKIFDPSYALELLRQHQLNFMPLIGFANFSNEMFVLSSGITEIFLGLLILFGLLPRFVGASLLLLFTLTLSVLGIQELVGHLPLYAVAFMLLIEGGAATQKKRDRNKH